MIEIIVMVCSGAIVFISKYYFDKLEREQNEKQKELQKRIEIEERNFLDNL